MNEVAYPSSNAWEADGLDYGHRVALLMAAADGMKLWQFALQMTKLAGEMARVLDGPQLTVDENRGLESPLSMSAEGEENRGLESPLSIGEAVIPERKVMLEALGAFCEANGLVKAEVSKAIKVNAGVVRFEDLTDQQIFVALGTLGVSVDDIPI